jgi:murein DD-endopeptidase MepM/ murein hydrolase activator NlpD
VDTRDTSARLIAGGLTLPTAGCEAPDPTSLGEARGAVRCDPRVARLPIARPHEIGDDPAWDTFTCTSGPGMARANSDDGGDHHGVDLFGPHGTPVVAVTDGVVLRAGWPSATSGNGAPRPLRHEPG